MIISFLCCLLILLTFNLYVNEFLYILQNNTLIYIKVPRIYTFGKILLLSNFTICKFFFFLLIKVVKTTIILLTVKLRFLLLKILFRQSMGVIL